MESTSATATRTPSDRVSSRKSVAFMTLYPYDNAASRARCYDYRAHLIGSGEAASVSYYPPSGSALFRLFHKRFRSVRPVSVSITAVYWLVFVLPVRLIQIALASSKDVIIVQRGLLHVYSYPALELILYVIARRWRHRTVLYDYDDALHVIPGLKNHYAQRCRLADGVIVSNDELARFASVYNRRVDVIETPVNTDLYKPTPKQATAPPRIGWAGSSLADLAIVEPIMAEVCRRTSAVFRIIGPDKYRAPAGVSCESVLWRLETHVSQMEGFDIGIAPMTDSPYDRARDAYKTKQYMALGLPVVVSPVGRNSELVVDGVNGYVARDTREWVERLVQLIEDPALRAELGRRGRQLAEERFSTQTSANRLIQVLRTTRGCGPQTD